MHRSTRPSPQLVYRFDRQLYRHGYDRGKTGTVHEGQFAPPRLSGRSAFSEETFAGRCGNEKDAP
jgi:hypothetical protein